jgi:hypothetical protein
MATIICPVCNESVWTLTSHQNSNGVITHYACREEYMLAKGLGGKLPKKTIISNPIKVRSLKDFSNYYLSNLKISLDSFKGLFTFISIIFWIQIFLSVIGAGVLFSKDEFQGGITLIVLSINIIVIIWFASIGKSFVNLQVEKVEHDIHNTIEFQTESKKMNKDILEAAMKKVENKITVNNGNAVFAFDGGTIHGVSQTLEIKGDNELVESLARLLSICKESNNSEALSAATLLSNGLPRLC